jgi:hypothetical protein
VLLKDHINTNDMPSTGGSLSLAGYTLPSPMRSAGAIILATKHRRPPPNTYRHRSPADILLGDEVSRRAESAL